MTCDMCHAMTCVFPCYRYLCKVPLPTMEGGVAGRISMHIRTSSRSYSHLRTRLKNRPVPLFCTLQHMWPEYTLLCFTQYTLQYTRLCAMQYTLLDTRLYVMQYTLLDTMYPGCSIPAMAHFAHVPPAPCTPLPRLLPGPTFAAASAQAGQAPLWSHNYSLPWDVRQAAVGMLVPTPQV